ncbi:aminodeoxychorismate synthase component I [Paraglaciecola aquimarina]|uniref:aminodeoxychorismate synthase n=1 Tax=Paraglaciecola aquimarina TaxID=1235557 RepID=A0ABU3SXD7_9ALTE|nr:aminodeoxychorismate synthase component I [Paraglaciecola aquimarina]MDU0354665.1 aminodeoxychorismate synthase component I [Paraglaciecola aquimarina]
MMKQEKPVVTISPLNLAPSVSIADIFTPYAQCDWSMLLDSSNGVHQDAKFDIFVADPIATITTEGNSHVIWHKSTSRSETHTGNPIALLQTLKDQYINGQDIKTDLPFVAGAVGYFGYDLGRQFETLPYQKPKEYGTPDMAVGIYTWSVIKNKQTGQFYLCYLSQFPHPDTSAIESLVSKKCPQQNFTLSEPWRANMDQAQYQQKIAKITEYLHAGDCYQVNLAQRFSSTYEGDEWAAYTQLTNSNQAPFSAFIRLASSVILSISPERFIAVKKQHVQTKPIKGTRPRGKTPLEDKQHIESLLNAEKDHAENLMIVDLLRNDLSKHCEAGSVKVPELFQIESFNAVHHLVSTVTGKLKPNSSPLDLLAGAFPGGSITGAPKIRAMQIIDELEPNNRNIYCGSVGYIGLKGDMDTNICIRTLLCERAESQNKIYCWAGGGIVVDSKDLDEYQESLDKVSKILPILKVKSV